MNNLLKSVFFIFFIISRSSATTLINKTVFESIWLYDKDINKLISFMYNLKKLKHNSFRLYEELMLWPRYEVPKKSFTKVLKEHEEMWFMGFIHCDRFTYPEIVKKGECCVSIEHNWNQ